MAKWFIHSKKADFNEIGKKFNISPVMSRIIRNRDIIGDDEIAKYLNGGLDDLYSPFLLDGMKDAVELIFSEIEKNTKIRIIGDYDIDGVCATYILLKGLETLGADVDFALPHRIIDGYGINERLTEEAAKEGIGLIVTCDNGIAANDAIAYAKEKGMKVIVTDHHNPPEVLPNADILINPKKPGDDYPYKEICGAVVAYKLIEALFEKKGIAKECKDGIYRFLQFAGFATVGDVVTLQDENRIFVKEGLKQLNNTEIIGLKALIDVSAIGNSTIKAYHLGFVLGPCINVCGRIESAGKAMELLLCEDYKEAISLASDIRNLNEDRKQMTEDALKAAYEILDGREDEKVLVVYLPDCHESIVGIVAGRIKEHYYKPTIVLTNGLSEGDDATIKGSARSIEKYDMFEELQKHKDMFAKFGGHKMAAGMTLKADVTPEDLSKALNLDCALTDDDLIKKIWIDTELPFSVIDFNLIDSLDLLEPFGTGNPKPVFALRNVRIKAMAHMGKEGQFLRFNLEDERGKSLSAVMFEDAVETAEYLKEKFGDTEVSRALKGDKNDIKVNALFYPQINEFRGDKNIQLVIAGLV